MSIVISIVKLPEGAVDTKSTHTFALQGGTIGRSSENEWILEDPERFISSRHSQVSFENGQYYLTDLSTNGTFANGENQPIGKGNTVPLKDGDKFSLGEYEFLASVYQAEEQPAAGGQGPFAGSIDAAPIAQPIEQQQPTAAIPESDDYFGSANNNNMDGFATPFNGTSSASSPLFSVDAVETDPLAALDSARGTSNIAGSPFDNSPISSFSQSDQADPMQQSVDWPTSTLETGGIPEDWDLNATPAQTPPPPQAAPPANLNPANFMTNDTPAAIPPASQPTIDSEKEKRIALEKANEKILAEIAILKKQAQKQALQNQIDKNTQTATATQAQPQPSAAAPQVNRAATNNEQTLIEALGLSANNLSNEKVIEINQIVGELVRETVTGMMQVLSSRSTIKNEFRMNVTTIQPVENNPLKFSANADDAIQNMFIKDGNAYKKPVEAIKEGFEGIAEHQIAILAGIRTAFKGVLNRFDPAVLEQRFEQFNKPALIPGMTKGKNWDSYKHYYKELVDDMDNSFQHLFGYEFVQAYEEQLQKLTIARKSKI